METVAQETTTKNQRPDWSTRSLAAFGLTLPCNGRDVLDAYLQAVRELAEAGGSPEAMINLYARYLTACAQVERRS